MCASVFARAKTDTRCPHWKDPRYLRGAYIMNHKKLLLTLTLCLCALLCMVVTAFADEPHSDHPLCKGTECTDPAHNGNNHGSVTFQNVLTSSNGTLYINGTEAGKYKDKENAYALPEGSYYLNGNLELNDTLYITGNVTLCMNGHNIKVKNTVVEIGKDGSFTLCDCQGKGSLIADTTSGRGVAFNAESTGSFAMYSGTITGAKVGNYGGGVCVSRGRTFTMYGGAITGNTASSGGGVGVGDRSTFTMYGGSITGNASKGDGGGIYFYSGTFAMYGGSVTGNSCNSSKNGGGVYISTNTAITLSGNVQIKDNYKGSNSNKKPSNIYLANNKEITVDGSLTGSSIGVTTETEPSAGSNVTFAAGSENTIMTGIFTPDTAGVLVGVAADGTSAYLYKCSHVYEWAYDEEYHWKKCINVGCDSVEAGSKIAHTWDYPADYNNPKTCICGATQGEPLTRSYYYYAPSVAEDKKASPKTADPGVLLYAGLALASLTGLTYTAKKRH